MKAYIIDTHALVWYLDADKKLSKRAEKIIDSENVVLVFPTIVLAEIKYLFHKKRIKLSLESVMDIIRSDMRCRIHPFDISCIEFLNVDMDLHDAAIVSVASVYKNIFGADTAVISKDREISKYSDIKTIW